MRFNIFLLIAALQIGCGTSKTTEKVILKEKAIIHVVPISYEIYFVASRTASSPPDEITIDSNGQMVIISQQLMADGKWKKPKGLAHLEPEDKAVLDTLIANEALFTVKEEDILPPCPNGADYIIKIIRKDTSLSLSIKTNTCAMDENTLSDTQRLLFKRLIQAFEAMRTKYRPQFQEKGK